MVQIPSAGMSQIYITSCMQLSVPDSCISSIKVHMIERLPRFYTNIKFERKTACNNWNYAVMLHAVTLLYRIAFQKVKRRFCLLPAKCLLPCVLCESVIQIPDPHSAPLPLHPLHSNRRQSSRHIPASKPRRRQRSWLQALYHAAVEWSAPC